MTDEVNTPEEKQKILMENGTKVTGDNIEPAWEKLM
jgi:hypothetical protein